MKNTKTIILGILLSLTFNPTFGQKIQWENTITSGPNTNEHTSRDNGVSIILLPNGGTIVLGTSTGSMGNDKSEDGFFHPVGPNIRREDYWVMRLDALGNVIWENTIGGTFADVAATAIMTSDGNIIIGGSSGSNMSQDKSENAVNMNIPSSTDYWIVKIDLQGNVIWDKTIGGTANDDLYDIIEMPNGDLILLGSSASGIGGDKTQPNLGDEDLWLVRINPQGSVIWDKTYGGTEREFAHNLFLRDNNNILISATSNSPSSTTKTENNINGSYDAWILNIDPNNGNTLWDNTIGGNQLDSGGDLLISPNNQIYVAGYSESGIGGDKTTPNYGGSDFWLFGLQLNGNKLWDEVYGSSGDEYPTTIISDGVDFYIAGSSRGLTDFDRCFIEGGTDSWLIKLDAARNIIWEEEFGGLLDESINDISLASNNLYCVGTSNSNMSIDKSENALLNDYWVMQLSTDDLDCCTDNPALYQDLTDLYNSTNGDQWTNNDGWLVDCDYCTWFGISCNPSGEVVQIDLSANNLDGPINPSFSSFTELFSIDLSGNLLTGMIPDFTGLSELEWISLQNNMLSGSIPIQIGDLGLEGIYLSSNNLSGCFPMEIVSICNIGGFDGTSNIEAGNNFTQSWEDFCDGLPCIDPCDNDVVAPVIDCPIGLITIEIQPNGIATAGIADFNISATDDCDPQVQISNGNFSRSCSDVGGPAIYRSVTATDASGNTSQCQVGVLVTDPNNHCCNHPDLPGLQAFYNEANGDQWTNTVNGDNPWFEDCDPCGLIDGTPWYGIDCNMSDRVSQLSLNANNLTGVITEEINLLTDLNWFVAFNNNLSGEIPATFCDLNLLHFRVPNNDLTGTIPPCFNQLPNILTIVAFGNNFSGPLPYFNSTTITHLQIGDNGFTGSIPSGYGMMPALTFLDVSNNSLSGCFPADLSAICNSAVVTSNENQYISDGNSFDASWEDFCATNAGACTVSVEDEWFAKNIIVYPNPFQDHFYIESDLDKEMTLELYSIEGQLLVTQDVKANSQQIISTSITSGLYLLRVRAEDKLFTYKIIKL